MFTQDKGSRICGDISNGNGNDSRSEELCIQSDSKICRSSGTVKSHSSGVFKRSVRLKRLALILLVGVLFFININGAYSAGFTDVKQTDWFAENVLALVERGVINGFPVSGSSLFEFRPQDDVKVDAFIKMTVTALGFTDIKNGISYWAEPFIAKAKELFLVFDGEFARYDRPVTRAEMARIIVRALKADYPENLEEYTSLIGDFSGIDDAYKSFIVKAYCAGILTGYTDTTFRGNNTAARSEAATIIMRLVDPSKRVVPVLPGSDTDMSGGNLYLYELDEKRFVKVETTHPELIEHIRAAMEIFSGTNFTVTYSKELNQVDFVMFTPDSDLSKPISERKIALEYFIYLESKPQSTYWPYQLSLYDTNNEQGKEKFKLISKDIFSKAFDTISKELDRKTSDLAYESKLLTQIDNRSIGINTFKGLNKIHVFVSLK